MRREYIDSMPHPWFARVKCHIRSVVPSRCAVCGSWPSARLCEACVARFAGPEPRCTTCARVLPGPARQCGECVLTPPPLDQCLAAVHYAYPWSDCITHFKFDDDPAWVGPLAALLRSAPWVEPALDAADLVLPIPLYPARLRARGFNQAQLLAQALAPSKYRRDLLLRIRDTPPQSGLGRAARLRNLHGAFAVEPLRANELQARRVVLIDDVMTTGASLHAAAAVLRQAGAAHITGLVLARTEAITAHAEDPILD